MSDNNSQTTRIHKDLLHDIENYRQKKYNNSIPLVFASKLYVDDKRKFEEDYNALVKKLGDKIVLESSKQSKRGLL